MNGGNAEGMVRIGELVIATMLLVVTLPLMLTIALAIKWESPGPALYRQNRIGPNGRCFRAYDFGRRYTIPKIKTRPGARRRRA